LARPQELFALPVFLAKAALTCHCCRHDSSGLVSLVVKEAVERPVKERLVAMKGQLVTIKEQAGEAPNGTAFAITTGPAPELDKTNLVVGKVRCCRGGKGSLDSVGRSHKGLASGNGKGATLV
jgi:hypothetical protein